MPGFIMIMMMKLVSVCRVIGLTDGRTDGQTDGRTGVRTEAEAEGWSDGLNKPRRDEADERTEKGRGLPADERSGMPAQPRVRDLHPRLLSPVFSICTGCCNRACATACVSVSGRARPRRRAQVWAFDQILGALFVWAPIRMTIVRWLAHCLMITQPPPHTPSLASPPSPLPPIRSSPPSFVFLLSF